MPPKGDGSRKSPYKPIDKRFAAPGEPCPVCDRPMPKLTERQKLKLIADDAAARDRKRKAEARARLKRQKALKARYIEKGLPVPDELADV